MSIRKKIGRNVVAAVVGVSLFTGGTFAYFSDTEVTNNVFAAGTLDLAIDQEAIINIDNIKPGDTMLREFVLTNDGSLKIENVTLETSYEVTDTEGNNGDDDFGKHIRVNFLWNWDKENEPVFSTTLYDLQNMDPDVVQHDIFDPLFEHKGGLEPGVSNDFWVEFEFVDNEEDQNVFQGDILQLEWKFTASQAEGEEL